MRLSLLLLSLFILDFRCFPPPEYFADDGYRFVNPTPENEAAEVHPGEPSAGSLEALHQAIQTSEYDSYLRSRGDSLFWFDFNGNGNVDQLTLAWEIETGEAFGTQYEIEHRLVLYAGSNRMHLFETTLDDDSLNVQIPVLSENTFYLWRVKAYKKRDAYFEPTDPVGSSPYFSFTTSSYLTSTP